MMATADPPRPSSQPRQSILFFAETVTLAHAARPVVLAQSLDSRQFDVHLAWDPRYCDLFPGLDLTQHHIESISTRAFAEALSKGKPIYDTATLARYVTEDLRLINALKPHAVVGDMRLSLAISARLAKVPYLAITNAYWSPYARPRYDLPELPMAKFLGVPLARAFFKAMRPLAFKQHVRPMVNVMRQHGLSSQGMTLQRVYTQADHTLHVDVRELVPLHNAPPNQHYIGSILWSPSVQTPDWWASLPVNQPIVYVTMGSSGASNLLATILQGLASLPVTVVAATAGTEVTFDVPPNAHVAAFLPGVEAAQRASLVICNGGSPTTKQALVAGKPVLAIPSNLDQYLNMDGLLRAGVGRVLRASTLTSTAVHHAAAAMLNDHAAAEKARQLALVFAGYDSSAIFRRVLDIALRQQADAVSASADSGLGRFAHAT